MWLSGVELFNNCAAWCANHFDLGDCDGSKIVAADGAYSMGPIRWSLLHAAQHVGHGQFLAQVGCANTPDMIPQECPLVLPRGVLMACELCLDCP